MDAFDIQDSGQRKTMPFEIDISNNQNSVQVDISQLRQAMENAIKIEQVASAILSLSIVDNEAIHAINREHLQHDYPTDVISFQLDFAIESDDEFEDDDSDNDNQNKDDDRPIESRPELRAQGAMIEGEIIASAQMASEMASSGQWTAMNELTLYVIHGLLHICGYDDLTPDEKDVMRARERAILRELGLTPVYPDDASE